MSLSHHGSLSLSLPPPSFLSEITKNKNIFKKENSSPRGDAGPCRFPPAPVPANPAETPEAGRGRSAQSQGHVCSLTVSLRVSAVNAGERAQDAGPTSWGSLPHARVWAGGCAHGAPPLWLRQLFPQGQGQEARARSRPASPWDGAAGPGSPSPRLPPHCGQRVAFTPDHPQRHPAPASCEDCLRKLRARAPKCPGPRPPVGRDALLQRRARSWGWAWGVRWRWSAPPHTAPQTSSLLRAEMTPGAGLSAACTDQSGEAQIKHPTRNQHSGAFSGRDWRASGIPGEPRDDGTRRSRGPGRPGLWDAHPPPHQRVAPGWTPRGAPSPLRPQPREGPPTAPRQPAGPGPRLPQPGQPPPGGTKPGSIWKIGKMTPDAGKTRCSWGGDRRDGDGEATGTFRLRFTFGRPSRSPAPSDQRRPSALGSAVPAPPPSAPGPMAVPGARRHLQAKIIFFFFPKNTPGSLSYKSFFLSCKKPPALPSYIKHLFCGESALGPRMHRKPL